MSKIHLQFSGQYHYAKTGLHYNYYRLHPYTGRYLTPDPIGLGGGINLFYYISNNPTNLIDPYGLTKLEATIRGAGAYAARGGSLVGAAAWVAGPAAAGALGYFGTQALIEGTWLGEGGVGEWIYNATHSLAYEMAKKSKSRQKERTTDIPIWVYGNPKGPGSEYSKIKKNCERGNL